MYNLVARYINNMSMEDVNSFAKSKSINLSNEELEFVYLFIKKNWEQVIKNPNSLNLERYKDKFNPDNFNKIKKLFMEYSTKYGSMFK